MYTRTLMQHLTFNTYPHSMPIHAHNLYLYIINVIIVNHNEYNEAAVDLCVFGME